MSQGESRLSRAIMEAIRSYPKCFCFKVHGSEHVMSGLPDIISCIEGQFVGFETKMPGKEENLSARQRYVHDMIGYAGGEVFVVSSVDDARQVINRILKQVRRKNRPAVRDSN